MGGLSYDRDVYSSGSNYSSSGFHSSSLADHAFKTSDVRALDPKLLPLNRHLECTTKNAIVIALDVTGSMGDSAKLLYDKLPMLWGQLEQQGYLKDFSISFAAVGDCTCDGAPFQVCDFAEGKTIDDWIEKLYLEGGGGGQACESYEMLAHFYEKNARFTHPKAKESKPFFFIIGDEAPYPNVDADNASRNFGGHMQSDIPTKKVFEQVRDKYAFKHIHVPYKDSDVDAQVESEWKRSIGDDFIRVKEPKAVVDVILGVVAITSGARTLEQYQQDMRDRGQTETRIKNVTAALKGIVPEVKKKSKASNTQSKKSQGTKKGRGKGQRL